MTAFNYAFNLHVATVNAVSTRETRWDIRNFSKAPTTTSSPKFAPVDGRPANWMLRCVKVEKRGFYHVDLFRGEDPVKQLRIKYTLKLSDGNGEDVGSYDGEITYDQCYGTQPLLQNCRKLDLAKDYLMISVSLQIYGYGVETSSTTRDTTELDSNALELRNNYLNMMCRDDGEITIHVGDRCFMAHQFILQYRAPLFYSEHEEEIYYRHVRVKDVDAEAFKSVLMYIYSAQVDEVALDSNPLPLYRAANKCGLKGMRRLCGKKLFEKLSVGNAREIIETAEVCEDMDLRKSVADFILGKLEHFGEFQASKGTRQDFTDYLLAESLKGFVLAP